MATDGIVEVRVVETVSDYPKALKMAVLTGVATVVVTAATEYAVHNLTAWMKRRRIKNQN